MTKEVAAAAAAAALISGTTMYTIGARTVSVGASANPAAAVETVDGRTMMGVRPVALTTTTQPEVRSSAAGVSAAPQPRERRVVTRRAPKRSWAKTAMIIGGAAAGGAGIGGIAGGGKGAAVGAAVGGSAASLYEATKR